jgi:protein-S-isoprenylcysteine O-methyltransferase Ste14
MIDALNVGQAKTFAIIILVALIVVGVLVGILVQKLVLKFGILIVIAALIGLVWWQRSAVADCAKTRQCTFFGVDVRAF